MFDNYVVAKTTKRAGWVVPIVTAAALLHAIAGTSLLVWQFWNITELDRPDGQTVSLSAPPPPPPPPPGGSQKKVEPKPKVKKVQETVQPDLREDKPEIEESSESQDEGVEGGVEGGVVGGVVGGVIGGVEGGVLGGVGDGPPPPPEPSAPQVVPQVALEAQRISGEKDIQPPNDVNVAIRRRGKRVMGIVKMCLSAGGTVSSLKVLKSTGFPGYDAKIQTKMRQWRYKPFRVNGKSVPVCTSVTFIYTPN